MHDGKGTGQEGRDRFASWVEDLLCGPEKSYFNLFLSRFPIIF